MVPLERLLILLRTKYLQRFRRVHRFSCSLHSLQPERYWLDQSKKNYRKNELKLPTMLAGTYQIHVYCVLEILLTNHTRAVDNNVNSLKTFQDCFERFLDNVPFADVCASERYSLAQKHPWVVGYFLCCRKCPEESNSIRELKILFVWVHWRRLNHVRDLQQLLLWDSFVP